MDKNNLPNSPLNQPRREFIAKTTAFGIAAMGGASLSHPALAQASELAAYTSAKINWRQKKCR